MTNGIRFQASWLAMIGMSFAGNVMAQAPDLTVSRIEVIQTVQDDAMSVPLRAGKATAVRVFIRQQVRTEPLITNVTALLRGMRDGTEIPLSPLRPVNLAISAQASPDRNNAQHSQDFILPAAWTALGKLDLRAELRPPTGILELPTDNNTLTRQVEFVDGPATPRMAWLPLCGSDARCANGAMGYQRLVERLFPLADGTLRYDDVPVAAVTWGSALDSQTGANALTAWLEKWRLLLQESALAPDVLVGWLPRASNTFQVSGGNGRAVWAVEQADSALSEQALAMQLAPVASGDPCSNGIQDPGFDPLTARVVPVSRIEFNSFCQGGRDGVWASAALAKSIAAANPFLRQQPAAGGDTRLLLSGTLGTDGSGTLDNAYTVSSVVGASPTSAGGMTLRVETASGTRDFTYSYGAGTSFAVVVSVSGSVQSVALLLDGNELSRLTATGSAPAIELTAPVPGQNIVRWTASQGGERPVTVVLSYSNDDGATWIPLAVDSRETQVAITPRVMLQGSLRFRLQASAGLDTAVAMTEPVDYSAVPALQAPVSTLDFGSLTTGAYSERTLLLKNTGNAPLTLTNFISSETFPVVAATPFTVRAGTERPYPVRAFPRLSGGDTATLNADTNDPAMPTLAVTLKDSVYDRPVPNVSITLTSLDFGQVTVGQTRELTFRVKNEGNVALSITSLSTVNARFSVVSPTGGFTLQPGEERMVTARFTPNAGGSQAGSLNIASNDPATPSLRVVLNGEGVASTTPAIDVSAMSLDFGAITVGSPSTRSVTIRNTGNGILSINAISISQPAFVLLSPVPPVTVQAGGQQVVSLQFAPSAAGAQTGTMVIASNDPARAQVNVTLTGSAQAGAAAPTPRITSLIPGSVQAGAFRFNLTVNGSNFVAGSRVTWNGTERPTVFVSSVLLRASISPDDVARAATATIGVSNPAPGGPSNTLPVIVNPEGAGAQIVNLDVSACPFVTSTVHILNRGGAPITALNSSNVTCADGNDAAPCTTSGVLGVGSRISIMILLHGSSDLNVSDTAYRTTILDQRRYADTIAQLLDPVDRAAIMRMDNGIRRLVDFRAGDDRQALIDAVDDLLLTPPNGVGTALYDGITESLRQLSLQTGRRKALFVFTASKNTYDSGNPISDDQMIRTIQNSGIPVYLFPVGTGTTNTELQNLLNQMAIDSGGMLFNDQSRDQVSVITQHMEALAGQSFVQYRVPNPDGTPHFAQLKFAVPGATFTAARYYPGCPR